MIVEAISEKNFEYGFCLAVLIRRFVPTFRTFPDSNFPYVKLLVIIFLTNTNAIRKKGVACGGFNVVDAQSRQHARLIQLLTDTTMHAKCTSVRSSCHNPAGASDLHTRPTSRRYYGLIYFQIHFRAFSGEMEAPLRLWAHSNYKTLKEKTKCH